MTPAECKRLIVTALNQRGVNTWTKLTAKTFNSLEGFVMVTIQGWQPNPVADELKRIAHEHHFGLAFEGKGFILS